MDDNKYEQYIDAALDSYPEAPLPPDFVQDTMRQVALSTRFRVEFVDVAVPAFIAIFGTTILGLLIWGATQIDPLWVQQCILILKMNQATLSPGLIGVSLSFAVLGAGVAVLSAPFVLWMFINRPMPVERSFGRNWNVNGEPGG
jgi:hypothetical protein